MKLWNMWSYKLLQKNKISVSDHQRKGEYCDKCTYSGTWGKKEMQNVQVTC